MAKKLKWGEIKDLQNEINNYFNIQEQTGKVPTIAGLCLHLGVSSEFWKYYTSDRWRTHRKSEEEIEKINKNLAESLDNEGFKEYTAINQYMKVIDNKKDLEKWEEGENYTIKSQLSATLKIAAQKFEDFTIQQIFCAKNPAGAIFYAKAALGYRENDPSDSGNNGNMPSKITINIMQPPNTDQLQQATQICIDTTK
jgi:hypothetical protein